MSSYATRIKHTLYYVVLYCFFLVAMQRDLYLTLGKTD